MNSSIEITLDSVPSPHIPNGLSDEQKIQQIEVHFEKIMEVLGLDTTDDSLAKTPHRYAKMLVKELCGGLKEENFPKITTQENKFYYKEMVIQSNMLIRSLCEHHFVPFHGVCHIAYLPQSTIIGLSKLSRVVQYYASRPQVQERITRQIKERLGQILETDDIAVVIDASHFCTRLRGVQDSKALTRTSDMGGIFQNREARDEFFKAIPPIQHS